MTVMQQKKTLVMSNKGAGELNVTKRDSMSRRLLTKPKEQGLQKNLI